MYNIINEESYYSTLRRETYTRCVDALGCYNTPFNIIWISEARHDIIIIIMF